MVFERIFIQFPTKVEFGPGKISKLGHLGKQYGKKAFIVMDPFFKSSDIANNIFKDLYANDVQIVENYNAKPNPRYTDIDKAALLCIKEKCDFVVALGGGSAIDSAKAIALVANNGKSSWSYTARENEYVEVPNNPGLPVIAIPTTSGTGSEGTIYSVINNPKEHRKCGIRNLYMYPALAIIDAEIMAGMPRMLTAMTGIDTFAHGFESYTNKNATKFSEMTAMECMRLFAENIEECCFNGKNIEARNNMAFASLLGGISISHSPTTIGHILGQSLSGRTDAPHGGSIACCLAQIIRWTLPYGMEKLAKIAELFDRSLICKSTEEKARRLPDILSDLFEDILGQKVTMGTYGLKQEETDSFAEFIFNSYQGDFKNYLKMPTKEDISYLIKQCMD
ncbi:MAG: iron-containing alcohol dehydrogenase [Eubacteriales bacterium]